jgi:glycosyltransferase involved in cell wall biosynthesis
MRRRPKIIYTVHGFLHTWDEMSRRDHFINRAERLSSSWTDATMFQSREDYDHARDAGYHGRLGYIGNGVSDKWFDYPSHRVRGAPFNATFVGRLTREKGIHELLWVAQNVSEVHWTIIGDALPSDRDSAAAEVRLAAASSDGRIQTTGMVSAEVIRHYLAQSDILVLPSWREGVPRSVIEAMAAGIPVIATDIRGCRELITPGVNGWLVPAGRPTALAAAVREAVNLPADRLGAMGAASREIARQHHREVDVFRRIEEMYQSLGVLP